MPVREEIILQCIEPVFLLVELYSGYERTLRNHCGPIRGVFRRHGEDISQAQCANCDRAIVSDRYPNWTSVAAIEGHPRTETMRQRLLSHGIRSNFYDYQDPGLNARMFGVETNPATLRIVRKLAKEDLGIATPAASTEFDRRFNLYFNQTYAFDCKDWQAAYPAEHWPAPADGWARLRDEFQLFQSS